MTLDRAGRGRVIRPFTSDEFAESTALWDLAFSDEDPPELLEIIRAGFEYDRTLGVFEDGEMVGTTALWRFELTVPGGGTLPVGGNGVVAVKPTHRRRGVMTDMMRLQLDWMHERREAIQILTASEPEIYGRFGFGVASEMLVVSIPYAKAAMRLPSGVDDVRLRIVDREQSRATCDAIFDKACSLRPGMISRDDCQSLQAVFDAESRRNGATAMRVVLAEADGEPTGYARYRTKENDSSSPDGTVTVLELHALDLRTHAALWRYLLSLDLMARADAELAVDDPLRGMLLNFRATNAQLRDELYLRIVEVGDALAARTYAAPVDVVLGVVDSFCPWNAGNWRLTGDEKGAVCSRTDDDAEIVLDVRDLGAAYLGGASLKALGAAGLVEERRRGALALASQAFLSDPAPWLPFGF